MKQDAVGIIELLTMETGGSIFLLCLCLWLFIITAGVGYLICGWMLVHHDMKKDEMGVGSGFDPLGVFIIWPIALMLMIRERNNDRK
jgi:hypothetical protein